LSGADLEELLRAIAREATGNDGAPDPLAGGALDSVAMVRLLAGVEDGFALTVPPSEITPENFASLPALVALVRRLRP
jgi:acyl carrier protein